MPHSVLHTPRLSLVPITLPVVEAIMLGRREDAEALIGARLPDAWPNRALIERAFCASLDRIRDDPELRLWGDRVMIRGGSVPPESGTIAVAVQGDVREAPRVVGSVVFHGGPGADGEVEVAYGVEQDSQLLGYATEAVRASVEWALADVRVRVVKATTPPWHMASRRVLEKIGMRTCGTREHDLLGDLLEYERRSEHGSESAGRRAG